MTLQPPRGTQDLVPPSGDLFWEHEKRGGEIFARAGYKRIVTPMFEDTAVFTRGVGEGSDIVSKEMYTFTVRNETQLTLRPEGTAPVIRAIISGALWDEGLPLKLWYSAAMFRYDRPQKGRYRQHHQLGVEAVGSEDPAIDAEVIGLGRDLLEAAGVTSWRLLLNSIGHPGCREAYLPRLLEYLREHASELDADCNRRMETNPLRVFDCKNPTDQRILDDAPTIDASLCGECRAHIEAVQGALKDLGVAFEIAPRLVRGLDYYTRTTFEFQTDLLEAAQSTVCGGGRYDGLSELLGGPRLPGIGFGSGIERVLLAADAAGRVPAPSGPVCFIVPIGEDARPVALQVLRALRARGLASDVPYSDRGLKSALKHADRLGARFAALLGEREVSTGIATVRDMASGEQTEVRLDDLAGWLEERTR